MSDRATRGALTGGEPIASRREAAAAALTMAVAAGSATSARAQASSKLTFSNPPGLSNRPAYSHVAEVNGPHRTIYIAGQTGVSASGNIAEGFRAQAGRSRTTPQLSARRSEPSEIAARRHPTDDTPEGQPTTDLLVPALPA
jgi:hypothetical protein